MAPANMLPETSRDEIALSKDTRKVGIQTPPSEVTRMSNGSHDAVAQSRKVLAGLYSESNAAKIWRVAQRMLKEDVSKRTAINDNSIPS